MVGVDLMWGIVLIVFTLVLCWLGQVAAVFSPSLAVRLGLTESADDVDSTYYADVHGEAIWDVASLWTLPVAGILLLLSNPWWAYFGLIGGGMYVYFAGRGIVVRQTMQSKGIRIGAPGTVRLYFIVLGLWGLIGLVTIFLALEDLPLPSA